MKKRFSLLVYEEAFLAWYSTSGLTQERKSSSDSEATFQSLAEMLLIKLIKNGIPSKEEQREGRPIPGSSNFRRENRMDTSTAEVKKLLSGDYLTFYMGNLSYRANDMTLKTAIENRISIKVDQAVIACSSDGRSRGCAFVTVRWKDYLNSHSDSNLTSDGLVQSFCNRLTGKPLFGRPVFVELACSQRRGG